MAETTTANVEGTSESLLDAPLKKKAGPDLAIKLAVPSLGEKEHSESSTIVPGLLQHIKKAGMQQHNCHEKTFCSDVRTVGWSQRCRVELT